LIETLIQQVISFIHTHHAWAAPIVFLTTLGESMLILGVLVPGTSLLLVCGGLVGSGALPMMPVLLWGIAGAIVGDAASYWIGRLIGPSVLRHHYLNRYRRSLARARLFFYRYGFLSILIGRFMGPVRCTIPTVAGALGMLHTKFQLANIISAAVWVPVLLSPGYFAAEAVSTHSRTPTDMQLSVPKQYPLQFPEVNNHENR